MLEFFFWSVDVKHPPKKVLLHCSVAVVVVSFNALEATVRTMPQDDDDGCAVIIATTKRRRSLLLLFLHRHHHRRRRRRRRRNHRHHMSNSDFDDFVVVVVVENRTTMTMFRVLCVVWCDRASWSTGHSTCR